jgi:hypothetical protein
MHLDAGAERLVKGLFDFDAASAQAHIHQAAIAPYPGWKEVHFGGSCALQAWMGATLTRFTS